ncbi:unnamed protein product [Cercospora beticola]|nr:unnamed protein product [Cercospora beticola]
MANEGKGAQRGFDARSREDEIFDRAVSVTSEEAGGIENGIPEFLRAAHGKLVGWMSVYSVWSFAYDSISLCYYPRRCALFKAWGTWRIIGDQQHDTRAAWHSRGV